MYLADSREAPYGNKSVPALQERCEQVTAFLIDQGAKTIVVACNTASVTALAYLRGRFTIPFVGIVPAVKPAAMMTHTGTVGVLVTSATAQSDSLAQLIASYSHGSQMILQECPELVALVEHGQLKGPEVENSLRLEVGPLVARGADILVLGCTHLPFLSEAIGHVAGPAVRLIDPAEAVVRHLGHVLQEHDLLNRGAGAPPRYFTTGDPEEFQLRLGQLLDEPLAEVAHVEL